MRPGDPARHRARRCGPEPGSQPPPSLALAVLAAGAADPTLREEFDMDPWSREPAGRFDEHVLESEALRGNPLGDPHRRPLWVYVPPDYEEEAERRYPTIYMIQGLTGQLDMWRNRPPMRPTFPELADRGIAGKSSGGYGAMVVPMLREDLFGGLATHAGDALFEACYLPDFRRSARVLRDEYGGSYQRFWEDFRSRPAFSKEWDDHLMNDWCMAACYSADPDGTVRLPYDPATGRLIPEVWERWLALDPVRMVPDHAEALRSMRAIYVDAGKRDEYFLDLGAEAYRRALDGVGVTEVFFEIFDAGHGAIEYRYPLGLRYLAERLG